MGMNYQKIAECVAEASKDPKYKVGAIIFDENGNIRSTGYNGLPRDVKDLSERYAKPLKQYYVVHAEANAIFNAARAGVSTADCCMLVWGKPPCAHCAGAIIQAGIKSVIFKSTDIRLSNYYESFKASLQMLSEAGIQITYLKE